MPTTHSGPDHRRAVLTALLVTVLWSSSWVLIRVGLDDESLEPLTFAGLRYGLASIALAVWTGGRPTTRRTLALLDKKVIPSIIVLGIVFYAATQGAQFVALDHQPAATSSLVLSWTPLLVAIVSSRTLSEPPTSGQVVGSTLVIAGAVVYFFGDLGATAIGMTAAVVGLVANVTSAILGRSVNRAAAIPPVVVTTLSMAVGSLLLIVTGLAVEGIPTVSWRAWALISWLAIVNTAVAFTLWNHSLRKLSAVESSAINNTMLVQIAVLAWIFLGEPLGVRETLGIVLVSLGIMLTQSTRAAGSSVSRR